MTRGAGSQASLPSGLYPNPTTLSLQFWAKAVSGRKKPLLPTHGSGLMQIPGTRMLCSCSKEDARSVAGANNCINNCLASIANDYIGSAVVAYTMTKYDTKINYASEKNTIFGRYSIAPYTINDLRRSDLRTVLPSTVAIPVPISEGSKPRPWIHSCIHADLLLAMNAATRGSASVARDRTSVRTSALDTSEFLVQTARILSRADSLASSSQLRRQRIRRGRLLKRFHCLFVDRNQNTASPISSATISM